MTILGIDPGQSGGIAAIEGDFHEASCWAMPATERDVYDLLAQWSGGHRVEVWLESVHSMPGQGVSSSFKFGRGYGFLRGCVTALGFRLQEVTPQKWQKALGCMSGGDKNVTKGAAQRLFPKLKITHATADALLICEYGRRHARGEE